MQQTIAGASVWEQDVYDQLVRHIEAEEEILASYRQLASDAGSPDIAYLAGLVADDEERHHRIFEQLAASIRAEAELVASPEAVPHIPLSRSDPAAVLEATDRLLAQEEADRRALRDLRRSLRPVAATTLWPLLVETMELDTRKHIAILRHIRSIAKGLPL
jgi:rubrerythrin